MQTIPGVEFESMLSELGKYGASFVLATQSLAKLNDLSPTMRHTLLANVGCLCVFQVSEEDIVSQPVHHCYVRATVGSERMPVFSMTVRKPRPGDPLRAARIREAASSYVTSASELEARQAERRRAVSEFRAAVEAQSKADSPPAKPKATDTKPKGAHTKPKAARPEPKPRDRPQRSASVPADREGTER